MNHLFTCLIFILIVCFSSCSKPQSNHEQNTDTTQETYTDLSSQPNIIFQSHYLFSPSQMTAIHSLLKDSLGWRIATASDCKNIFLADVRKEDSTYEPYFKEDDFNIDEKLDFAIAIKHDSTIAVYWFANLDSTYSKPELLASANWFDECGFSNSPRPGFLGFGLFYSDVGAFYKWNSQLDKLEYSNFSEEYDTTFNTEDSVSSAD